MEGIVNKVRSSTTSERPEGHLRRHAAVVALVVVSAVGVIAAPATAHTPFQDGRAHDRADDALVVPDPDLSQVAYQDMSGRASFWIAVDLVAGQRLVAQLGVPDLARLADYRPSLAIVGPGVGTDPVPLELPSGTGAFVIRPLVPPRPFDEIFTGTRDVRLAEGSFIARNTGRHYVVAYGDPKAAGKLFVTLGTREAFGLTDLLTYHDTLVGVRRFHEVSLSDIPPLPSFLDAISLILRCLVPDYPRPTPGMWPS
jgi:hypothetical protein